MPGLTVVTGPPCAGKSTYIAKHRKPGDLVIDLDAIAFALGYPADHIDWATEPSPFVEAARAARIAAINYADTHPNLTTWLIDSDPHPTSLRIWQRRGVPVIDLDPGAELCHERAIADHRSPATHQAIDDWYATRPTTAAVAELSTQAAPALSAFD